MTKILTLIKQLLCRHKEKEWMKKESMFYRISGETHYLVCKKCRKVLGERDIRYD